MVLGGTDPTLRDVAGNDATLTIASGSNLADSEAFVIDTTAPSAPTAAINLLDASDTGSAADDNKTSDTTPTLRVSLAGTNAVVGDTVELLLDGNSLTNAVTDLLDSTDISNGYVDLTVTNGDLGSDGTKVFTARVTDVAGNVGAAGGSLSVTLDTTAPTIAAMSATNDTYIVNENVDITVTFSETVVVTGTPTLTLSNGATATYQSGTGANLVFRYTVTEGQTDDADLEVTAVNLPDSATIKDIAGNAATLTITDGSNDLATGNAVLIDANSPDGATIAGPSDGTYELNDELIFTVDFDQAVVVGGSGTPRLALSNGEYAVYSSSTSDGTNLANGTMAFKYVVSAGDTDTADLTIATNGLELNNGTIQDANGNNAKLTLNAAFNEAVVINLGPPSISSMSVTDGSYGIGDNVDITVTFSEEVTVVGGTPTLTLSNGDTASYVSGSGGTDLVFRYSVASGDTESSDLEVTQLNLVGATIQDSVGGNAVLTITDGVNDLATNNAVVIDVTRPTIDSHSFSFGTVLNATEDNNDATLTVNVTGANGQDVTVTLNSIDYTGTVVNGVASVTIDGADLRALTSGNTYAYSITVSDAAGNAVASSTTGSFDYDASIIEGFIYDWSSQKAVTGVDISNGSDTDDVNSDASFIVNKSGNSGADAYAFSATIGDGTSGTTGSGVDINDALLAFKMAFRSISEIDGHEINPYQYYAADMDENGYVDIRDAMSIYSMALGRNSAPDVEWIFIDEAVDFWNDGGDNYMMSGDDIDWSVVGKAQSAAAGSVSFVAVQKGDINGSWAADNDGGAGEGDAAAGLTALARLDALATAGVITDVAADKWWV